MRQNKIWELVPKDGYDYAKIVTDLANGRPVDLSVCTVIEHASTIDGLKDYFKDYVAEHGISSLLRTELILEHVISSSQKKNDIALIFQKFMTKIGISDEVVIVDPYFFASTKDSDYCDFVEEILNPFVHVLTKISIVTLPDKVDLSIKSDLTQKFYSANASINITHKTSTAFHDRFWLNPKNRKGFLSGTSLNGLGRRYSVVDYLEESDVMEILQALSSEGVV